MTYSAPFGVVLDDQTSLEPDILYVAKENYWKINAKGMEGVPDLVVEILSPGSSSRDLVEKRPIYKRNSVKEIWFVSPLHRTVEIERLGADGYQPAILLEVSADALRTPLLPGFEMTLSALFSSPLPIHQAN